MRANIRRLMRAGLVAATAASLSILAPIAASEWSPIAAKAQTRLSIEEFHQALDPYGRWERHPRWGDVWMPTDVRRDWRPYQAGRWRYTDEWGWYWVSNESEEAWGWVTYHYGRWAFDRDLGWIWIPGREWGPAWVSWRRGDRHIGWAPLPPDELIEEVRDEPEDWVFVRDVDFVSPSIEDVAIVRTEETRVFFRETTIENRTVVLDRERIAVNPGIPVAFVARAVGRPLHAVEIRPPIVAGTVGVTNSVEVRTTNREQIREHTRLAVTEKSEAIRPAERITPPTPLRPGEKGRLGENPPTAARTATRPGQPPGPRDQTGRPSNVPGVTPPSEAERNRPALPERRGQEEKRGPGRAQEQNPPRNAPPITGEQRKQQPQAPNAREERRQPGAPREEQRSQPRPGAIPQPGQAREQQKREAPSAREQREPPTNRAQSRELQRQQNPPGQAREREPRRESPAAREQRQPPAVREQRPSQPQTRGPERSPNVGRAQQPQPRHEQPAAREQRQPPAVREQRQPQPQTRGPERSSPNVGRAQAPAAPHPQPQQQPRSQPQQPQRNQPPGREHR